MLRLDSMPIPAIRFTRVAGTFVLVVCLSIVGLDAWRTYTARDIQLAEGIVAASNLSRAIAQHAVNTFKEVDIALMGVRAWQESAEASPGSTARIHALLARYTSAMNQVRTLSVVGREGQLTTSSDRLGSIDANFSDAVYFKHHQSSPSRDAFLGPVIKSEMTGEWVATLSRRLDRPDGSFGGVVLAYIDLSYFRDFYEDLDIGRWGTLLIASQEGQVLQRRPDPNGLIGTSLAGTDLYRNHVMKVSEGALTQVSSIDRVKREIAFKKLDEYPIYVVAGLATSETLAPWVADATTHTAFVLVLVAALGVAGYRLVSQIKRRSLERVQLVESQRQLTSANARLASLATEDGLTGLSNRRDLDRVLLDEVSRARRLASPLSFILLDVDFFKSFNDFYGHVAGDGCLRAIAGVMAECAKRPGDLAARYGGEEFALVLPGVSLDGALSVATRICSAVEGLAIPHAASPLGVVTISAGVNVLDQGCIDPMPNALISGADAALYAAKDAGKNRASAGQPRSISSISRLDALSVTA